jgi:hypothetical protein
MYNKQDTADHFYFNVVMPHDVTSYGVKSSPASFITEMTNNMIDNPSDYYISIVRFSVPGNGIPITIFPTDNNDDSIISLTLLYNSTTPYQTFLEYVPDNPSESFAAKNFFVYSYQGMLNMMNTALQTCTNLLNTDHPGTLSFSPYFIYDANTELISLITPYTNIQNNMVKIFANTPLFVEFLNSFQNISFNRGDPNGLDIQITTNVLPGNANGYAIPGSTLTNPPAALKFTQEYVSLQYWSAFKNLAFISASLPIIKESIPQSGDLLNSELTGQANYFPILTDFEPLLSSAGDARSQLQYYPQGPYRYVNMISNIPLRKIDVRIFWQDKHNNLYPLTISFGQVASIKLLFRKRTAYKFGEKPGDF